MEVIVSELRAGFYQTQKTRGSGPCGGSSEAQSEEDGLTQPGRPKKVFCQMDDHPAEMTSQCGWQLGRRDE